LAERELASTLRSGSRSRRSVGVQIEIGRFARRSEANPLGLADAAVSLLQLVGISDLLALSGILGIGLTLRRREQFHRLLGGIGVGTCWCTPSITISTSSIPLWKPVGISVISL